MTFSEFQASLSGGGPPPGTTPAVAALWYLTHDNWAAAHEQVDTAPGTEAAAVHALLHRIEGDE